MNVTGAPSTGKSGPKSPLRAWLREWKRSTTGSQNEVATSEAPGASSVQVIVLIVLCALTGVVPGSLIEHRSSMWVGTLAALFGGGVAFVWHLWSRTRPSRFSRVVSTLIIIVLTSIATAFAVVLRWRAVRSKSVFVSAMDAFTYGWSTLATSPVPAFAEPRTLLPIALVSCCAAATSVSAALWSRGRLVALLPPMIAFLFGAVVAGRQQFAPVPSGLALVILSGLTIWVRTNVLKDRANFRIGSGNATKIRLKREAAALISVAAISIVGGLIVGPALAFGRDAKPFDPRDQVVPPSVPENVINPLELVGSQRQSKQQLLFSVRSNTPLTSQDLHLVALNHFDGASWTTTSPYERAGAVLEPTARRNVPIVPVQAEITLSGLEGPWLPSIGDPTALVGFRVLTDPSSGSMLAAETIRSGARYRLTTGRAEPAVEPLILTPVGSSAEAKAALFVAPGMPPLLENMARTAIGDVERPFERAVELRNYLRTNFKVSKSTAGGYSYGHLEIAFTKSRQATEEQFAAMFATLGRVVGLPTRMVVGFDSRPPDANGIVNVYASDARVWAEVLFENVGWLPFIATPAAEGTSSAAIGFGGGDEVELQKAPPIPDNNGPAPIPAAVVAARTAQATSNQFANIAIGVAVIAGTLIFAGLSILALKRRRTKQRRSGSPRQSVMGAWHDVLDRFIESGVPRARTMTVDELIHLSEPMSTALAGLYRPVNSALYSNANITDADRAQAWRARDRFVRSLNRQATMRQRFQYAVDPRTLRVPSRVNGEES
jgi:transglutaminase-like putative cysteine protease